MRALPIKIVFLVLVTAALACASVSGPTQSPRVSTATPEEIQDIVDPVNTEPGEAPDDTNDDATDVPEPTAEPTPVPTATDIPRLAWLGDVLEVNGYSLAALKVVDPGVPSSLFQAEEGRRLIAVEVIVGNVAGDVLSVNPLDLTLADSDGFSYQVDLVGLEAPQIAAVSLSPGERVRGWVGFQIAAEAAAKALRFSPDLFGGDILEVGLTDRPADQEPMVGTERTIPEWPNLGDVVEQGGYSLTAVTLEDPSPPGFFTNLDAGYRLVSVELVLGNVSGADHSSNPLFASLVDTDGFVYAAGLFGRDEGVLDVVTLRAGDRTRGWVSFVVPDGSVPESVKYEFDLFTKLTLQTGLSSP